MDSNKLSIKKEIDELNVKEKIRKFEQLIQKSKGQKMAKIAKEETEMPIRRRGMPAELMNELFSSMPFESAFGLLTKMPNGLLARNIQKMINCIKESMKNNKLNEADCGPKITISEDGLEAKHSGLFGSNSVRALLPIPPFNFKAINKPTISFYFEVEILNGAFDNSIGLCDQQFPLENQCLGCGKNSIGIKIPYKKIWIDGFRLLKFENASSRYFKKGDFVGIGIIYKPNSSMEIFVTSNGKFLVKVELPSNFAHFRLFPSFNLYQNIDSIGVNFGKKEWQFKEFGLVLG